MDRAVSERCTGSCSSKPKLHPVGGAERLLASSGSVLDSAAPSEGWQHRSVSFFLSPSTGEDRDEGVRAHGTYKVMAEFSENRPGYHDKFLRSLAYGFAPVCGARRTALGTCQLCIVSPELSNRSEESGKRLNEWR